MNTLVLCLAPPATATGLGGGGGGGAGTEYANVCRSHLNEGVPGLMEKKGNQSRPGALLSRGAARKRLSREGVLGSVAECVL